MDKLLNVVATRADKKYEIDVEIDGRVATKQAWTNTDKNSNIAVFKIKETDQTAVIHKE